MYVFGSGAVGGEGIRGLGLGCGGVGGGTCTRVWMSGRRVCQL